MAFTDRLANRGSISTTYEIENSLRVQHTDNEYLYRDNPTSGNRRTFTFSFWLKRASISVPATNYLYDQYFMGQGSNARFHFAGNTIRFMFDGNSTELEATQQLRDNSAWYHIVLAVDTTQGTNTNRVKAYVNGNAYAWNNSDWPSQNAESQWMHDQDLYVGTGYSSSTANEMSGYFADVVIIDGQQLTPSSFGETDEDSGIWKPKDVSGLTFGDEGVWLKFDSSGSMGADSSGNSNNFTLVGIDATNQSQDTPSNNFCTLNPNWVYGNAITTGPSHGNLRVEGGSWAGAKATFGVDTGKWYWEYTSNNASTIIGVQTDEGTALTGNAHNILSTCGLYLEGEVWIKDSTSGRDDTDVTQTFDANEVYGIALNMDDNQISFYQDGTLITNAGSIALDGLANKVVFPFHANYNSIVYYNFGNPVLSISSSNADANGYGNFEHAPPSGYYALCTKNLAEFG